MSNKRAALYVRLSTDAQTVENQIRELRQVAGRRGWDVVEVYSDAGISGAKGRNGRPGLDSMLKDASRRKFDIVMAWAIVASVRRRSCSHQPETPDAVSSADFAFDQPLKGVPRSPGKTSASFARWCAP